MGLDMWIFSIEKPEEKRIPPTPFEEDMDNLRLTSFAYYDEEKDEEFEDMFGDIYPYSINRVGYAKITNYPKIKQDYKIPFNTYQGGFSSTGTSVEFRFYDMNTHESYSAEMSNEDYNKKYIKKVPKNFLITKTDEVQYWRKEYDIQSDIYDVYNNHTGKDIINCGYHVLTKEMIEDLNERNEVFADCHFEDVDGTLVYHEWY